MRDPSVGFFTLIWRGLRRRCPRCDGRGLFPKFLEMKGDCPTCGLHFERDDGYWTGAMIMATAFTLFGFLALFIGGIALTWPNVPWNLLLISTIAITGIVPVAAYSTARTTWVAIDLAMRPLDQSEVVTANQNRGSNDP